MFTKRMVVNRLWQMLFSPSMRAYGIKGANILASFLATLILARVAGAAVVGDYSLATSTAALVGMVAMLGLNKVLLREVSGNLRQGKMGAARGAFSLLARSMSLSAILGLLVYFAVVFWTPVTRLLNADHAAFLVSAIGIPATVFFGLAIAALRGARMPVEGQFLESAPSLAFLSVIAFFWLASLQLVAPVIVAAFFLTQLVAGWLGYLYLRPTIRSWGKRLSVPARPLYGAGIPIMLTSAIHSGIDWLLLATVSNAGTAAEVGAFRVAAQIMLLMAAIVTTGESYIATYMAGDFRIGRPDLAWRRQRRSTLLMLLLGGLPALVCLVAPRQLLGLVFGPEFAVAGPSLAIMAVGQLISLACGPTGAFLIMAGKERLLFWQTVVAFAVAALLTLFLVPRLGLLGAAIAYSATLAFRRIGSLVMAWYLIPRQPPATV